jgi:hypothetical protein
MSIEKGCTVACKFTSDSLHVAECGEPILSLNGTKIKIGKTKQGSLSV